MRIGLWLRAVGVVALLLAGSAGAQGARSLALAGTTIPGRDAGANPAHLALPAPATGFELALPLGALQYFTSDWANPTLATFDALPLLNQIAELNSYLLLTPRSPAVFGVRLDADGLSFSADGRPLTPPNSLALSERFDLPIRFSVAPQVQVGLRPYASVRARGSQSQRFSASADGIEVNAALAASLTLEAGVALDLAAAWTLEPLSEAGPSAVGGRLALLVGLAYASLEGAAELAAVVDLEGGISEPESAGEVVLGLGGLLGEGVGFGVEVDLGWIGVLDTEVGPVTVELFAERLGATWWTVDETTFGLDGSELDEETTEQVSRMQLAPFSVTFAAALAVHDRLGLDLPEGGEAVVAVNLGYGLADGVRASIATEVGIDALTLRAGLGYDGALRAGVGLGYDVGPIGADVALSASQALLGGVNLGVGASLRLVWGR